MTLAVVFSRACAGIDAPLVTVEVHMSQGFPGLSIVGLPEAAVKESKDRVRSALINSQFEFPIKRITINLAPADLPKEGGRFDLPIALGILAASQQIPQQVLSEYEFAGELALSGELRPIRGALPFTLHASKAGRQIILPSLNADEAGLVKKINIFAAKHLLEVCAHLKGQALIEPHHREEIFSSFKNPFDLADVIGQLHPKRALEIAAAGKHSLLFMGPPGTGKTMLANRITSILPSLTEEQALEAAAIASVSGAGFHFHQWRQIPFRSPHHSSSNIALVGGGRPPRPGEISLAHHGVLFLDEMPEFHRQVLESLREPLESGKITISRAGFQAIFPAQFQLIAAMNPCPCGFYGSARHNCRCTEEQVQRYLAKLSGPLLDRLDMHVTVPCVSPELLVTQQISPEKSSDVKARVMNARQHQYHRQKKLNQELTSADLQEFCIMDNDSSQLLKQVMEKFNFSARVYHRIIKVARTIADLLGCEMITAQHISEALTFRCLDRARISGPGNA